MPKFPRQSFPGTQDIAAATGTLSAVSPELILVSYTATGAVTDLEFTAAAVGGLRQFKVVDTGGAAGTNSITIKNTADTVIAVISEDNGSVTLVSDGTNIITL